jgi:hypothetical protein
MVYGPLVLTRDVRFEGFTAGDWSRLLALFQSTKRGALRGVGGTDEDESLGGVIAIHDGLKLRKLLHTRVGRLDLRDHPWPLSVKELADRHHASWGVALREGALEEVMERFGARATQDQDILMQGIIIGQILRDLAAEGAIETFPTKIRALPTSTHGVIFGTLRSVCPENHVLLTGIFEEGELFTSLALRRQREGFDLVMGPDELRPAMGLLSGDFRRDYRHIVRATENLAGPLAMGLFTERKTLLKLIAEDNPGAWARAAAVRDVVFAPLPATIAVPLGIDATRGFFAAAKSIAMRLDWTGLVAPTLQAIVRGNSPRQLQRSEDPSEDSGDESILRILFRLMRRGERSS